VRSKSPRFDLDGRRQRTPSSEGSSWASMTLLTGVGDSSRFVLRHGNWVTAIAGDGGPGRRPAVPAGSRDSRFGEPPPAASHEHWRRHQEAKRAGSDRLSDEPREL